MLDYHYLFHIKTINRFFLHYIHVSGVRSADDIVSQRMTFSLCQCVNVRVCIYIYMCVCMYVCVCVNLDSHLRPNICLNARANRHRG